MAASSKFVQALITFASECPENLQAIRNLRDRAMQEVLGTPDGTLVSQIQGMMNGKQFQFKVDRPLSELLGEVDEVLRTVSGDLIRVTTMDFTMIRL